MSRHPAADRVAEWMLLATYWMLPATYGCCLPLTSEWMLPATYWMLPATYWMLPATYIPSVYVCVRCFQNLRKLESLRQQQKRDERRQMATPQITKAARKLKHDTVAFQDAWVPTAQFQPPIPERLGPIDLNGLARHRL